MSHPFLLMAVTWATRCTGGVCTSSSSSSLGYAGDGSKRCTCGQPVSRSSKPSRNCCIGCLISILTQHIEVTFSVVGCLHSTVHFHLRRRYKFPSLSNTSSATMHWPNSLTGMLDSRASQVHKPFGRSMVQMMHNGPDPQAHCD